MREDGGEELLGLGVEAEAMLPVVQADAARDEALAALVPEGARLRLVSSDGWVVGQAGTLNLAPAPAQVAQAEGWRGLLYRLLLAPPAGAPGDFAPDRARLDAPVVWQALSGVPATQVRASGASDTVVVGAAGRCRARTARCCSNSPAMRCWCWPTAACPRWWRRPWRRC